MSASTPDPLSRCCLPTPQGVEIKVKVVPGASRSQIAGVLGDALKVQVAAPPEKGKANEAVIALLAAKLQLPRSDISLIAGATSPRKTFLVRGISLEVIVSALASP